MRYHGISGLLLPAIRTTRALHGQREWSQPKHDVSEGIMTLADNMRSKATLNIGLNENATSESYPIQVEESSSTLA